MNNVELADLASSTNIYSHFSRKAAIPADISASLIMIESLFGGHSESRLSPPGWLHPTLTVSILQTFSKRSQAKLTNEATCILSIVLPPGLIRLSSGAIIIALFLYLVGFTGDQSRDAYLSGVSCALLVLRWVDLVGIHTPEKDFWKEPHTRKQSLASPWERLKWFFFLWNNQR